MLCWFLLPFHFLFSQHSLFSKPWAYAGGALLPGSCPGLLADDAIVVLKIFIDTWKMAVL